MLSGSMVAHIMNAVTIAQKLSAMNDWLPKKTTITTITMVTSPKLANYIWKHMTNDFELKPFQPMNVQKTSLQNKVIVLFPILTIVQKLFSSAVSFSKETTKLLHWVTQVISGSCGWWILIHYFSKEKENHINFKASCLGLKRKTVLFVMDFKHLLVIDQRISDNN